MRGHHELYAIPSREEMVALKETQALFKSNLFRLQLEEFLKEVQVDYTKQGFLESTLHALRQVRKTTSTRQISHIPCRH